MISNHIKYYLLKFFNVLLFRFLTASCLRAVGLYNNIIGITILMTTSLVEMFNHLIDYRNYNNR